LSGGLPSPHIKSNQTNYFIVRLTVDQRAGQLSLPHLRITKTEKIELKHKTDDQISPVNCLTKTINYVIIAIAAFWFLVKTSVSEIKAIYSLTVVDPLNIFNFKCSLLLFNVWLC